LNKFDAAVLVDRPGVQRLLDHPVEGHREADHHVNLLVTAALVWLQPSVVIPAL
jgi:nanoRNase/pAp phosphatase (c-di-AMP/oligoRNAs hydrolase)